MVTGVLYIDDTAPDLHDLLNTVETPLNEAPMERLCPGSAELQKINKSLQ